jgi:Peptidase inhibitor family I36
MSRIWSRRSLGPAALGTIAAVTLALGGLTAGTAIAAPAATISGDVTTTSAAIGWVVQPASAAARAAGQPNEFDVFDDPNFQNGSIDLKNVSIPDLTDSGLSDSFSSAANNSSTQMCLFTDANFQGARLTFPPNTQIQQFSPATDNKISSVKPC